MGHGNLANRDCEFRRIVGSWMFGLAFRQITRDTLYIKMGLSNEALKNLFDVLRTVNLTVTAISLGLLSNVIIALNDVSYLARKEVQDLERIKGQVGDYTANSLFQDVAREFGETLAFPLDISLSIDPNEKLFTQTFVDRLAIPSILHPVVSFGSEEAENDRYASGTNSPIKQLITLGQLRWFWDALAKKRYLLLAEPAPLLVLLINKNTNSVAFAVPYEVAPAPTPGVIFEVRNSDLEIRGDDSSPKVRLTLPSMVLLKDQRLRSQQGEFRLTLDFPARILHADTLVYLLSKCKKLDPKRVEANAFDDVFPNLARLGANYRSLTLSGLDGILEDESKRSKGELEVFGAKIPSELVTWVGLPLLAVLLLQFASVCIFITKRVDTIDVDAASQWSFLLSGFGFVLFGFGTTCLLPIIAAALSFWYVTAATPYRWPFWGSITIAVIVVSCLASRSLHRLRRIVRLQKNALASHISSRPSLPRKNYTGRRRLRRNPPGK